MVKVPSNMPSETSSLLLEALEQGRVCLHPTDTVPGITFDPRSPVALQTLLRIKGRAPTKAFIGLVASLESACRYWKPLPDSWRGLLEQLWPGSLSVIWQAVPNIPPALLSTNKTLCLRFPVWPTEIMWMAEVVLSIGLPLPTTSVNQSGAPSMTDWSQARRFCQQNDVYVPAIGAGAEEPSDETIDPQGFKKSSTIIELFEDGSYVVHREGAVSVKHLENIVGKRPK